MDENLQALREAQFQRSCDRYAAKLAAGRGAVRRDGDAAVQVSNYVAGNLRVHEIRSGTARVLDASGVSNIVRPYYYNFALALGKRARELWSSQQLLVEARILVTMWMSRGLQHDVLLAIARGVLNLELSDTDSGACTTGPAGL